VCQKLSIRSNRKDKATAGLFLSSQKHAPSILQPGRASTISKRIRGVHFFQHQMYQCRLSAGYMHFISRHTNFSHQELDGQSLGSYPPAAQPAD
jgi:hypothetical protein